MNYILTNIRFQNDGYLSSFAVCQGLGLIVLHEQLLISTQIIFRFMPEDDRLFKYF